LEPHAQIEVDAMISDAENMIRDTPRAIDIKDSETGPQGGFIMGVYSVILTW